MAKNGIKSFSVKVDLENKIKLIITEFGQVGFAVIVHLYRFIHSMGYYSEWSRDVGLLFIQEFCHGVGWSLVSEIVECAVRRGVFDSELYQKHAILTSKEIQETYLKATSRQKSVKFHKNYALPVVYDFIQNVDKERKNAYIFDENVSNPIITIPIPITKKESKNVDKDTQYMNNNAHTRESYEEIIRSYNFSEFIQSKIWEFIKHCNLNKNILTNDKLKGILTKLKYQVLNDSERAKVIHRAIDGGYFNIKLDELIEPTSG